MRLPYGISDFRKMRTGNYVYLDKTYYIEKLENYGSEYLFFIRPRRFGKSLFLSMLAHYYDVMEYDSFESLFDGLYIGQNPTPLRNSYLILELDFSGLNTKGVHDLERSFCIRLKDSINGFIDKYTVYIEEPLALKEHLNERTEAGAILYLLIQELRKTNKKMYLIIDEYDHFANDIIAMGEGVFYKEMIHASGFVRDFYETVKIGTKHVIDRIFITGISPIMLDDLTSGFNISTNLTMSAPLNEMMGFTGDEVMEVIRKTGSGIYEEPLMEELRKNYNGYLFNEDAQNRVYNPNMLLYFFNEYQMTGHYPKKLIDDNVKTDYGRLQRLISNEQNRHTLEEIIKNEGITADIVSKFSFDRMYDGEYFVSLLFYMGLLTIDRTEKMRLLLKIPNYVIKTVFWEYVEKRLHNEFQIYPNTEELRKSIEQMAYQGEIAPYVRYIGEKVLKPLSNRDLMHFDEKLIKVLLFTYLMNSRAYKPYSEKESENGYIDIYLERDKSTPDIKYEWILELKYLKKSEEGRLEEVKRTGLQQLHKYAASRDFMDKSYIKQALLIYIGKDEVIIVQGI